jgi:atypical dual specificity phosphatase
VQSFSWLIDGVIAGSGMPGRLFIPAAGYTSHPREKLENDLRFLWERGIRSILSLTEQPLDDEALRALGFDALHLPIFDMSAPRMDQVERALAFIEGAERQSRPVLIHCTMGRGRTGTLLACYLVRKGVDAQEAIRQVRLKRPGSIETLDQELAVHDYEALLREGRRP